MVMQRKPKSGKKAKYWKKSKKAGFNVYFAIIDIILIITASLIIFSFINSISNNRLFERKFIAEDVALLTGTIAALPGRTSYFYDEPASKNFSINLSNGFIIVVDKNKNSFPVFIDKKTEYTAKGKKKGESLFIKKYQNRLYFGDKEHIAGENKISKCSEIETKDNIRKKIISIRYNTETKAFADKLAEELKTSFLAVKKEKSSENSIVDIIIIAEKTEANRGVEIYYNTEKGKKLSCLIKNNIVTIAEMNEITYSRDSSLGNRLKLRIVLGKTALAREERIITAIKNGLKEYYS